MYCTPFARILLAFSFFFILLTVPTRAQTTFTVTAVADDGDFDTSDGICDTDDSGGDGPCTLRAAIEQANATANAGASTPDRIEFDIAGSGPHVIAPTSFASAVNEAVVIDGTTEPNYSGSPVVVVDGAPNDRDIGLTLSGTGSTVRGLSVIGFNNMGISLSGSGNHTVAGCYIGVHPDGTTPGNPGAGIYINGDSENNLIGGPDPEDRNIVSGNGEEGVVAAGRTFPVQIVDGTTIRNNWIGLAPDGTTAAGNGTNGVAVGGPGDGIQILNNVVADNGDRGIDGGNLTNVVIQGNRIGTTVDGMAARGNSFHGFECQECSNLQVGGTSTSERNLISNNGANAINLIGEDPAISGVVIEGNWIGVDAAGTADFGNDVAGITLQGGFDAPQIGGPDPASRNVIAGSGGDGIVIDQYLPNSEPVDDPADAVLIQNNYIGLDATGMLDRGSGSNGILFYGGSGHQILDNVISGSTGTFGGEDGIELQTSGQVLIQGNLIGTRADGTGVIGNTGAGISCGGTCNVTIGGTGAGEGNRIVGSGRDGIYISQNSNPIVGNVIGLTANGVPAGSGRDGIHVAPNATNFTIGGATPASRNTIAHSGRNGITVEYDEVTGTLMWADSISIRQNKIIQSEQVGIDLDTNPSGDINDDPLTDGETLNDGADDDTDLPNELQNFPEFSRFAYDSGANTVTVDVAVPTATANAEYPLEVEFFRTGPYGQAEAYLGTTTLQSGDAQTEQTVAFTPQASLERQDFVVATVTSDDGRTSEINPLRQVVTLSGDTPTNYDYEYLEVRINGQATSTGSGSAPVPIRNELRDPENGLPSGTALAIAGSWMVDATGSPSLFELCLPLDNLINDPAVVNESALAVYGRVDATSAWQNLATSLEPGSTSPELVCGDVTSGTADLVADGGEYIVAADPSELPVELAALDARIDGNQVVIEWTTASESDNARFEVQRRARANSETTDGSATERNASGRWNTIGTVEGAGTTSTRQSYRFSDDNFPFTANALAYRLRQVDADGSVTVSDPVDVRRHLSSEFQLHAPFPNPARRGAIVRYELSDATDVTLTVYDVMGRKIRTLVDSQQPAGRHEITLNTREWAAGLYVVRLTAGGDVQTRRMSVVR